MLCSGNDQCTRLADALTFAGRPGKATPSVHPQLVRLRADARAVEVSASSRCRRCCISEPILWGRFDDLLESKTH